MHGGAPEKHLPSTDGQTSWQRKLLQLSDLRSLILRLWWLLLFSSHDSVHKACLLWLRNFDWSTIINDLSLEDILRGSLQERLIVALLFTKYLIHVVERLRELIIALDADLVVLARETCSSSKNWSYLRWWTMQCHLLWEVFEFRFHTHLQLLVSHRQIFHSGRWCFTWL